MVETPTKGSSVKEVHLWLNKNNIEVFITKNSEQFMQLTNRKYVIFNLTNSVPYHKYYTAIHLDKLFQKVLHIFLPIIKAGSPSEIRVTMDMLKEFKIV